MLVVSRLVVPKEKVVVGKNEVPVSVADDEEDNEDVHCCRVAIVNDWSKTRR